MKGEPAVKVIEESPFIVSGRRGGVPVNVSLQIDGQNDAEREERHHEEKPDEVDLEPEVADSIGTSNGQHLLLRIKETTPELAKPSPRRSLSSLRWIKILYLILKNKR